MKSKGRTLGLLMQNYIFAIVGSMAVITGILSNSSHGLTIALLGASLMYSSMDRNVYKQRYGNLVRVLNEYGELNIKRVNFVEYEIVEDQYEKQDKKYEKAME